jgi:hypothetical protein
MTTVSLNRLENNMWGYTPPQDSNETTLREIHIITPQSEESKFGFILAQAAAQFLQLQHITKRQQLESGFFLQLEQTIPSTAGRWNVSLLRHDSWVEQIQDAIPFTKIIRDRKIAKIVLTKESRFTFFNPKPIVLAGNADYRDGNIPFPNHDIPQTAQQFFGTLPFTDPFTRLSLLVLQTVDPHFVSERKIYTSFRITLLQNGQGIIITEIPNRPPTNEEIQENKRAVAWYRNFLIQEFGQDKLQFVDTVYGFSLSEMLDKGLPLAPDHVFKINIGMNKIDLSDIKTMFDNLIAASSRQGVDPSTIFPRYQLRKFAQVLKINEMPTMEQIAALASPLSGATDFQLLPPDRFNYLVNFVMFSPEERERAYTGRKINLWAISGTVTLGDPHIYNPSNDLAEILQVFPQFEKTDDWENYCELLSHVLVKKALYEPVSDSLWKVGLLIPGPQSEGATARWFYIESFCDDSLGNVNYLLLPACKTYTTDDGSTLPMVKAYRSTASDQNCIAWAESVAADLNPYGSPSSLDPKNSFLYEKPYFDERTIPLWAGYMLAAEKVFKEGFLEKAKEYLKRAINEYHFCLHSPGETPPHKLAIVQQHYAMTHISQDFDFQVSFDYLYNEAKLHKELPENKVAQPLFLVGHSLGASLSQFYTYYFLPRRHRIPLPEQNLVCYASRGPAIDTYQDEVFMQFGRLHSNLLNELNQTWHTRHDLEYGDFLPQAGQSHLGTTGYDQNLDTWLDPKITVFKPLETAEDKGITTLPTHARRTGMAEEDLDFEKRSLSVKALQEFDHACIMPSEVRDMFGFLILQSSKVTEAVRQVFAIITRPFVLLALWIYRKVIPLAGPRDENNVLFIRYTTPPAATS